jgi:hypothetical protein
MVDAEKRRNGALARRMPMKPVAALLLAALPLAACGSETATEPEINASNASVEEVAEQVREASAGEQFIRPGKWLSQVRFEEMNAPGVPAGAAERLNEMAGGQTFESCLTEEQSRRPNEDFFSGRPGNQCRYEKFTMGDGKIDATMRCSHDGAEQVMQMEGSYSPDSYQLRMTSNLAGVPGAPGNMQMRMRIDAKRVGECDAPADGE